MTFSQPNNHNANKRIAKNTIFLYFRLVIVLVISLYTSRVILNTLGVVDYGIYNVVAGFVYMLALLNASLTNSAQRFYNYEKSINGEVGVQKVFVTSIYIQVIIVILILLFAETIGIWYINNKMVYPPERYEAVMIVYHFSVLSLLFMAFQIPYSAALIAHEYINYYAIVGVIDVILKLLIALLIPYFSVDNLAIYGILMSLISAVDFLLYFFYCRKKINGIRFKYKYYKETFVEMLGYYSWSTFNGISQIVKNQGLNILMNLYFGPVINAARGISYQIKGALLGFVMNITTAAQPQMIEAYTTGNYDRAMHLMSTISKFIFFSLFIVALPLMLDIDYVLYLWLGNGVPNYASIFTILVLVITMVDILLSPITIVINATGQVGSYYFWTSNIGLLVLPFSYIALEKGVSPEIVYVISLLLSILALFFGLVILKNKTPFKLNVYLKNVLIPILKVVIISLILPLTISIYLEYGFARFLFVSIISVMVTSFSIYFIGLSLHERQLVKTNIIRLWDKFFCNIQMS